MICQVRFDLGLELWGIPTVIPESIHLSNLVMLDGWAGCGVRLYVPWIGGLALSLYLLGARTTVRCTDMNGLRLHMGPWVYHDHRTT